MPHRLKQRQAKIQAKRKTTPWRKFVMEIGSRRSINFYRNQNMISKYPPTQKIGTLTTPEVFGEDWQDVNNKTQNKENKESSFFTKYAHLFLDSVLPSTNKFYGNNLNSEYADIAFGVKNCYLGSAVGGECEDVAYSCAVYSNCTNIFNAVRVTKRSTNVYDSRSVTESYNVFFSTTILNSSDIWFSNNLIGCTHCMFCSDLQNASYCMHNKQLSKQAYQEQQQKYLMRKGDYPQRKKERYKEGKNIMSKEVSGTGITYSTGVTNGRNVSRINQGRNLIFVDSINSGTAYYDCIETGLDSNHFYGVGASGSASEHVYCSIQIGSCTQIYHCYLMESCSYCLGCIGLKNKSYCILNKQYTKEERYDKVDEIFTQMEQDGDLGKFFPGSLNPFYFNDTAAYLIDDSFTKQEVETAGYMRRDEQIKVDIPEGVDVISVDELDQYEGWMVDGQFISTTDRQHRRDNTHGMSRHINPSILKKVIQDPQGNVYRIVKMEYDFLMKHALPLPRKHWLDRIKEHFKIERNTQ